MGGVFGPDDTELLLDVLKELLLEVTGIDELVLKLEEEDVRNELLELVRGIDDAVEHTDPLMAGRCAGPFATPLLP